MAIEDEDDPFNEEFDLVDEDDDYEDEEYEDEDEEQEEAAEEVEPEPPRKAAAKPTRRRRAASEKSNAEADASGEPKEGSEDGKSADDKSADGKSAEGADGLDEYGRPLPTANYVVHVYEHRKFLRTIDRPFTPEDAEAFATEYSRTGKSYGRSAVPGKDDARPKKTIA